jgi:hypothetical protein
LIPEFGILLLSHGSIGTLANSQPRRVREKPQMRNAACMPFEGGVVVSPPLEEAAVNSLS